MSKIKRSKITVLTVLTLVLTMLFSSSAFASSSMPAFEAGEGVYLLDPDTRDTYAKQNETSRYFPASTTKILTALTAMDVIGDSLEEKVTAGKEITMIEADSSVADLVEGDQYSWKDLLYGLLLPSGNDAAMTIAVNVARIQSGDSSLSESDAVAKFAEMMNQKASESGAVDSHFVNPHGLYNENHYTTPVDMAHIAKKAFENQLIKDICKTTVHSCLSGSGKAYEWQNSNVLIQPSSEKFSSQAKEKLQITDNTNPYYCSYATEGKTGYDELAGRCLVFSGENGEMKMLGVIFKASDMIPIYSQSKTALENGLTNYAHVTLAEPYATKTVLFSSLFSGLHISLSAGDRATLTVPSDEQGNLTALIEWDETYLIDKGSYVKIQSAFEAGTQVATLHVTGETYGNDIPLYAVKGMKPMGFLDIVLTILVMIILLALVFYLVIQIKYRKIRKKEKRQKISPQKRKR